MFNSFLTNDLVVFSLDQLNHYQLHHLLLNEQNLSMNNDQQIEVEHCCCCLENAQGRWRSKLISCSHLLSFINMSCETEEEKDVNNDNMHFIDLDTRLPY